MYKIMRIASILFFFVFSNINAQDFLKIPPKLIGDQFGFTEGPVWIQSKRLWLFTDIIHNKVYSLNIKGELKVYDDDSGYANGLNIDKKGNIWYACHNGTVIYKKFKGKKRVAASSYEGKRLNSPNDIAIQSNGAIWFTDPNFGISIEGFGPQLRNDEQPVRGIYQIQDGKITLKDGSLKLPNGIAFSLDEKYLYTADTADGVVYRFDFDGKNISNKKAFAKVKSGKKIKPMADGIKVDSKGNLYVTAGPGGFAIFSPSGEQLEHFLINSDFVSNIAFGGEENKKLMVTGMNKVYIYDIK